MKEPGHLCRGRSPEACYQSSMASGKLVTFFLSSSWSIFHPGLPKCRMKALPFWLHNPHDRELCSVVNELWWIVLTLHLLLQLGLVPPARSQGAWSSLWDTLRRLLRAWRSIEKSLGSEFPSQHVLGVWPVWLRQSWRSRATPRNAPSRNRWFGHVWPSFIWGCLKVWFPDTYYT